VIWFVSHFVLRLKICLMVLNPQNFEPKNTTTEFFFLHLLIPFQYNGHYPFILNKVTSKWRDFVYFYPMFPYSRYLQEIGYTDTIIDVRSARVRSLLGLQPQADTGEGAQHALVNGDMNNRRAIDQGKAR